MPVNETGVVNSNRITIAVHGWGDSREGIVYLKRVYPQALPGNIITYNCPDATSGGNAPALGKTSFGQLPDIMPFLYLLKKCVEADIPALDLRGHSRGGAVVMNTLALLNNNTNKYQDVFTKLSITETDRKQIISMIENGAIVLECPLTHVRSAIKQQIKNIAESTLSSTSTGSGFFSSVSRSTLWASEESTATSVDYSASTVTNYKAWKEQPLDSAKKLDGLKLKILFHTETDKVVSNENDEAFYQLLAANNPEHTYRSIGTQGNHNNMSPNFYPKLHAFRQKYDAAYDPKLAAAGRAYLTKK